jgi:hypothetical protein
MKFVEWQVTYSFFDLTELLELLAKSLVVGMPCEASVKGQSRPRSRNGAHLPNEEFRHVVSDVWDRTLNGLNTSSRDSKRCARYNEAQNT